MTGIRRIGLLTAAFAVVLALGSPSMAGAPPKLKMLEFTLKGRLREGGAMIHKIIHLAVPAGWTYELEPGDREVQMVGPEGEGEIYVAALAHPAEMGRIMDDLKSRHPGAAPSPPQYLDVRGINNKIGERATRFELTGREAGELVMIERGGVIVLFAAIVEPSAWPALKPLIARCYPTVQVEDKP